MDNPRAALAEAIGCYGEPGKDGELARQYLAERGVLLVTEPMLAAVIYDLKRWMQRTDSQEAAAAIFAALKGEQ